MGSSVNIVWFKRDLRIEDHRALAEAARRGPVLPIFVVEPDLWAQPDMSGRQWDFVRETLAGLQEALARLGQPLIVRTGAVTDVLDTLSQSTPVTALWSHEETGNAWTYRRDVRVADWCRSHGIVWREIRQNGVIRRIASRNGWAGKWDRFMAEPLIPAPAALRPLPAFDPGAIPTGRELGLKSDHCPQRQTGGRGAALETLTGFLAERGETYRSAMSSPVTGAHACSRLSPHLAWGVVSMREVAQATWARQRALKALPREEAGTWRGAMTSFSGRLHWRDHFTQKLEDEPGLEHAPLHPAYAGLRPAEPNEVRLAAWRAGETGLPFVDACMRSLAATGWLNFRMRAMVMAVASYHLWLDWRKPGEHLARRFTDYDAGIHWPQVQMQSGTTGINTVRIYNPVKQGHDQDPDGVFVRRWVPELAAVPDRFLQQPWAWDGAVGVLGKTYPHPIVDHLAAAKEARQKVWAVRRGPAFRDRAARIQDKHGSRKSGMPMTGGKAKTWGKKDRKQLSLALDEGPGG